MNDPQDGAGQALEAVPIQQTTTFEEAYLPQKSTVDHWLRVAGFLADSGITPRALDTPQKVLGAWLKGKEMGIPPMLALQHIYIVEGKAGISAELQLSLVRRAGIKLRIVKQDDEICIVEASRVGQDGQVETHTDQFTYTEARIAGLHNKFNWKSYRRDMLRARATTRCLRFFAPDVTHGCMLADELEAFRDGLSDLPAGATPSGPPPEETPQRIAAPEVTASSRKSTGDSRVRGPGTKTTTEPEVDAEAGADERAGAGGSDAEDLSDWRPAPESFEEGGKHRGIADARRIEGWRAFVTGTSLEDFPRELGERAVKWWKEGWTAADKLSSDAIVKRLKPIDGVNSATVMARAGASACLEEKVAIKECPHPAGSQMRFYWLTGYNAAAMTLPDEEVDATTDQGGATDDSPEEAAPPDGKPATPAPTMAKAAREGLETQIAEGFESLGLTPGVAKDVIKRRYDSDDLATLSDAQIQELDRLMGETMDGDNDGSWMDPT
jgi:hypothetical protein